MYIESAKLDGVNSMQELFLIITPMVWSTFSTLFILSFIGIFSASGPILFFTNGAYNTTTLSYWIFLQVKDNATYNYPSAVGLFFTIIGVPLTLIVWKVTNMIHENVEY